jgi:hypothetical protein
MREARFRDVLIDSTGALLAQAFVWGYAQFHRKSTKSFELQNKTT